jgi:hypothetical protein
MHNGSKSQFEIQQHKQRASHKPQLTTPISISGVASVFSYAGSEAGVFFMFTLHFAGSEFAVVCCLLICRMPAIKRARAD